MATENLNTIGEILREYDRLEDKENIDEFLKKQLKSCDPNAEDVEIEETFHDISSIIDALDTDFQDFQNSKKNGISSANWLKRRLEDATKNFTAKKQSRFIKAIQEAFVRSNQNYLDLITDEGQPKFAEPLKSYDFEDESEKKRITRKLHEDAKKSSLLQYLPDESEEVEIASTEESPASLKNFFTSPLGAPQERNIKKVIAAGVYASQKRDLKEGEEEKSPQEIGIAVDLGVTGAKTAYKAATGEIKPSKALDYMADKTLSAFATMAKNLAERSGEVLGENVGQFVAKRFSLNIKACRNVGRQVGRLAGEKIGNAMEVGIKKVGKLAIQGAKKMWEGAKGIWNRVSGATRISASKTKRAITQ